jgi:hypothetical protein
MSTAYHPQSDGQAEKANATLETFLKAYIPQLPLPEQWTRLLPLAEFTYNVAKHNAIGMSPFKADIGYVPRLPLDLLAPSPQTPGLKSGATYAEKMARALRMLRERMEETQLTMATEANEKRQAHPFRVGDEVFLDTTLVPVAYGNVTGKANDSNNSQKFQHLYAGPFTLLRKAGENAFVLDIPTHWCLHPVFNVSRLKPSRVDRSRKQPSPQPLRSTTATTASGKSKIASSASGCARRTRRFRRNLRKPDAARHGTLRPDEERHGICLPDEGCQGIFLPDAAVSSRRSRVIWTQL